MRNLNVNCVAVKVVALALLVSLLNVADLQATFIVKPIEVTASSQLATRPDIGTIDGSGLAFDLVTGAPIPGTYPAHSTDPVGMWAANNAPFDSAPSLVFDLGDVYEVSGFHVWNFNQASFTNVGVQNATVTFSTTSALAGFGSPEVFSGANAFAQGPQSASYLGEDKDFSTVQVARWVRIDRDTNWGNGSYPAGLSEIRFFADIIVPIPEPSSFVLLGMGAIGLARHNRRRKSQANTQGEGLINL